MNIPTLGIALLLCMASACRQNQLNHEGIQTAGTIMDFTGSKPGQAAVKYQAQTGKPDDFSMLVPLKIVDEKSTNAYEKYGIDFDGHCYTCDLAVIRMNKKNFDIINVCDKNDLYRYTDWDYKITPDGLSIRTKKTAFIFSKIKGIPVYALKMTGEIPVLKKKKLSGYYTPGKELKKFKQHDCGAFDG